MENQYNHQIEEPKDHTKAENHQNDQHFLLKGKIIKEHTEAENYHIDYSDL